MPWHRPSDEFLDASVPKLANLYRAARAGLLVPPTIWARAEELEAAGAGAGEFPDQFTAEGITLPCIIRSGSPTEDTQTSSSAGQFASVPVRDPAGFGRALRQVLDSLPLDNGRRQGVVFVQPMIEAELAGVTFFDGFYFEETTARGRNHSLTSGRERGQVRRGHVQRGDRHLEWLVRLHEIFGGRIDVEWAGGETNWPHTVPYLLQVRPALFPIRRCETLSLANHKEILGDPPSPWIVSVLAGVSGHVMGYFAQAEPAVAGWDEPYAIELGERAWLNFSAFFRLMDEWGLPRTMVTEGVGGVAAGGELDQRFIPARFVRKLPTMVRIALCNGSKMAASCRGLHALQGELDRAQTLRDLHRVNVQALAFSIQTNFAIMMALSVASRVRKRLGLEQAAQVVTQRMMARYAALAARPNQVDRLRRLDDWLRKYGHRGPLESDPCQPRFAELRDTLRATLMRGPLPAPQRRPHPPQWVSWLGRPLFLADEIREWFRDRLMRWWQRLRARILEEARKAVAAGYLEQPNDVFFLRSEDLDADPATWRQRVTDRKLRWEQARRVTLPTTATRDEIEEALARPHHDHFSNGIDRFQGIGLGSQAVSGTAVRASDLKALLNGSMLPESPVLIASTLEPSWAVIFPRFAAVVAELGGELSHAAILLREAGITAVVNAEGAYQHIADGDQVLVDAPQGLVVVERRHATNGKPVGAPPADANGSLLKTSVSSKNSDIF